MSAAIHRLRSWITLALTAVAGLAPSAQAARTLPAATGRDHTVIVREIGGALFFSERGGPFQPIPNGPAKAALRGILRAPSAGNAALEINVGPSMVADGASGWHKGKP